MTKLGLDQIHYLTTLLAIVSVNLGVLPTFYHTNTHRVDYIIGIRQGRDQFVQAVGKYINVILTYPQIPLITLLLLGL